MKFLSAFHLNWKDRTGMVTWLCYIFIKIMYRCNYGDDEPFYVFV